MVSDMFMNYISNSVAFKSPLVCKKNYFNTRNRDVGYSANIKYLTVSLSYD